MVNVSIRRRAPHAALAADLERAVGGEVRFDEAVRGAYARDASHFRQIPMGVVVPRHVDDVEAALAVCREHDAPVLPRGGGTSLAGQCCNAAVVIDCSRHLRAIDELDPDRRAVVVEPGVVLDDLQREAAPHGLRFGPDPATHAQCTLGGMIGNNACGVRSLVTGRTSDNVDALEILTYDGHRTWVGPTTESELDRLAAATGRSGGLFGGLRSLRDQHADAIRKGFPDFSRRVSGYNLDELLPERGTHIARALVGTEGTCALVLRARLTLVDAPPARALAVLGYRDIVEAARRVPEVLEFEPVGLEGVEGSLTRGAGPATAELPRGGGYLFVELAGETRVEARDRAERLAAAVTGSSDDTTARVFAEPAEVRRIWSIRESGIRATTRVYEGREVWPGWEDSAVPAERFGDYLADLRSLMDGYGYHGGMYGHFGEGCLHIRIDFDLQTADGRTRYRRFMEEAADLAVSYGGSLSGEHGDGQARGELLERMYGPELVGAFHDFKTLWDPQAKMNPGKIVDPRPIDADLAAEMDLGAVASHFEYPDDDRSFAKATVRCVGVGKCRDVASGTMCPSYMATREEIHSTRGRARLLAEMLDGEAVTGGWRSDAVAEALDLCLACKGCLAECPVSVDMATYKAEFLAHRYAHRPRPAFHYAMGLLPYWMRAAAKAPRLAHAMSRSRLVGAVTKRIGGVAPERDLPEVAPRSFRAWFDDRPVEPSDDAPRVLLWPDTFTNHFHPAAGRSAVGVLEAAGYRVQLPQKHGLCCGLPMITSGMLPTAKRALRRTLRHLGPALDEGLAVVGLEPSCAAVFRHDLPRLLPGRESERLAERTRTLAELLAETDGWVPPVDGDGRSVLLHGHCHQEAVMGADADRAVLEAAGFTVEVPDAGCCGLAGSFGFERGHHDVAMAVGERVLLPRVRSTADDTAVVTDGFSCRTQIAFGADRRAQHLAEVLAGGLPDADADAEPEPEPTPGSRAALGAGAAAAGAAGLGWWLRRRR